jgi:flagellar hook-associated protein 3 FlgL
MITGMDAASEQFLASVGNLQTRLNNAQNQLSSGLRVNKASDAPDQVGDIFQTRADLAHMNQVDQNLGTVKAQVDAADSSLQSAVLLLQNATVLGAQGASSTVTQAQRNTLASQIQDLQSQMVALSRTQVNGVYIFSGDTSGQPAYQLNNASATGVDRLITSAATTQIADPTGVTFQIAKTAQDIFDKRDSSDNPAPENAFAALQNLKTALLAGDTNAINSAISAVKTANDYLNQQSGFYGTAQNRISSSIDLAKKFEVQSQAQLSALQDADVPSQALQLSQLTTDLDAAMAARSKRPTTSLFDYLPAQ